MPPRLELNYAGNVSWPRLYLGGGGSTMVVLTQLTVVQVIPIRRRHQGLVLIITPGCCCLPRARRGSARTSSARHGTRAWSATGYTPSPRGWLVTVGPWNLDAAIWTQCRRCSTAQLPTSPCLSTCGSMFPSAASRLESSTTCTCRPCASTGLATCSPSCQTLFPSRKTWVA